VDGAEPEVQRVREPSLPPGPSVGQTARENGTLRSLRSCSRSENQCEETVCSLHTQSDDDRAERLFKCM